MISDEAVETAAKGIFALDQGQHMDRAELEAAWERLPSETERDDYRYAARAALEAAAPHIIAGYIRETNLKAIAYELETPLLFKKDPDTPNPFRSQA